MKSTAMIALLGISGIASAVVVPNSAATTEADGVFSLTTTVATGRTYQMTIAGSELTGLNGLLITGMAFRLNNASTAAWPNANVSYADWDIHIGPGVAPGAMSNTFADNFTSAPTQVRDGALSFNMGEFTAGASGTTPNAFGPPIKFDSGYLYTGGDLTIEMRFSAQVGSTTQSPFDAVLASGGPGNGWGVNYAARWTGNMAGTSGANGNFLVTQFQAVPEPATLTALGLGALMLLRRRRQAN